MGSMGRMYYAKGSAMAVTDTGDFLQLRNGAGVICRIHEIRVWQESDTTLAMNTVRIQRGVGGSAGTGTSEDEMDIVSPASAATAFTLPTTDVGTLDLTIQCGWNILQEFVWLPTPDIQIHLAASDELGLSLRVADTLTIGASIWWEEIGV